MRMLWLGMALWNTIVAAINVTALPLFFPPEAMAYVTPLSQMLPIAIPFVLWASYYAPSGLATR